MCLGLVECGVHDCGKFVGGERMEGRERMQPPDALHGVAQDLGPLLAVSESGEMRLSDHSGQCRVPADERPFENGNGLVFMEFGCARPRLLAQDERAPPETSEDIARPSQNALVEGVLLRVRPTPKGDVRRGDEGQKVPYILVRSLDCLQG